MSELEFIGLSRVSAQLLDNDRHLIQSIEDILTTPRGSRVMRPEYGSNIFELLDRPINGAYFVDLYYEAAVAIARWEPRVRVVRIWATAVTESRITLDVSVFRDQQQVVLPVELAF